MTSTITNSWKVLGRNVPPILSRSSSPDKGRADLGQGGGLEGGGQRKLGNCGFVASLMEPLTSVAVAEAFFDRENFNIQEDVR